MVLSIIAGNWKMNTTLREAETLAASVKQRIDSIEGIQTVVCPPFVSLAAVGGALHGSRISVGAQNLYHEVQGAYTGEVSPTMLADLCHFVIVGHSERRRLFGESDELINMKVRAALSVGLRPILCVGEQLEEREQGRDKDVVERQLSSCLRGVDSVPELVVAYEPVWAIGTGRAATPDVAQAMMAHIRAVIGSLYGEDASTSLSLLYGGSVGPSNILEFMQESEINGALVGGASLDADSFAEIVRRAAEVVT